MREFSPHAATRLMNVSCLHVVSDTVFAFRAVRASNYSLKEPFKHLGAYLRGHALLYATALRSRQRLGRSEFLEEGVKDALSDLSATLGCLSCSRLNDAEEHTENVKEDIIRPVSHVVHALSRELDSFQPLLPPDFCVNLETFFSEFKGKSTLYEKWYYMHVPWQEGRWYPSDLYDAAQALIEKLRNSASLDTHGIG